MSTRQEQIAQGLCSWFVANCRTLPFRETKDAYCIWISEIMAQQTRISALIPYYERFIAQFPTVEALANADEDAVLKAWQGLGYYSRARNLHKAARIIVEQYGGRLPADQKALLSLPGIGAYTAGAILSIAYEQCVPAIDGNALRVFSRLEANDADIAKPQTQKYWAAHVAQMMPEGKTSIFTQAVMELGALICLPTSARCGECPVRSLCRALASGQVDRLPVKQPPKPPREEPRILALIHTKDRVLMRKRTEKLLHNLWEFPGFSDEQSLWAQLQQWNFEVCAHAVGQKAQHVFSHIVWQMQGVECYVLAAPAPAGYRWVTRAELESLATPTALKVYVKQMLAQLG